MAPPCCYHYKNQISKRSKNCQSKLLLAGILLAGLVLAAIQFFFGGGPGPILTFGISTMLTSSKILSIFTLLLFKLLNVVPKHISSPLPSTLPLTAGIEILIFLLSHGLQWHGSKAKCASWVAKATDKHTAYKPNTQTIHLQQSFTVAMLCTSMKRKQH